MQAKVLLGEEAAREGDSYLMSESQREVGGDTEKLNVPSSGRHMICWYVGFQFVYIRHKDQRLSWTYPPHTIRIFIEIQIGFHST